MNHPKEITALLQELISAYGPCGQEDEVRDICLRELRTVCEKVWTDPAGNAVGFIPGKKGGRGNAVRVMAHMDELSLIVKRVNADGTLRVNPLGGIFPYNMGQGPMDILGDKGVLPGVLSLGPMHTTKESEKTWESKVTGGNKALDWDHVYIFTRKSPAELVKAGVHAGTRVVISKTRRILFPVGDCLGGFFHDDRAAIVVILAAAALLKSSKRGPSADLHLVMTTSEEIGAVGASYAARTVPGDLTLAVDVGPAAGEYGVKLSAQPVVVYQDASMVYDKAAADRLVSVGKKAGLSPQQATWQSYGSDASISQTFGQTARSALLCLPTENTHGFEVIVKAGLANCARLLAEFLM